MSRGALLFGASALLLLASCHKSGPSPEYRAAEAALNRMVAETEDPTESDARFIEVEHLFLAVPADAPDYQVAQGIAAELHQKMVARARADADRAAARVAAEREEAARAAEVPAPPAEDLLPAETPEELRPTEEEAAEAVAPPPSEAASPSAGTPPTEGPRRYESPARAPAQEESAQATMERTRAERAAREGQAKCSSDYATCVGRCSKCNSFPPHMKSREVCRMQKGQRVCTIEPPEWSKDITQDVCCQSCYEARDSCLSSGG